MSDETFVTVEAAARSTGISASTLRSWIATGKLTATAERRGKRVMLADVERLGRVTGKIPDTTIHDPSIVPGPATPPVGPLPDAGDVERQAATLREGLVAPLVELTERQQQRIAELEREAGRLSAERDALQARLSALEAAYEPTRDGDCRSF